MLFGGWSSDVSCSDVVDGVVGEATGEGFRQQRRVGVAVQRCYQVAVVVAVAGGVVPAGGTLHERDSKVLHVDVPGVAVGAASAAGSAPDYPRPSGQNLAAEACPEPVEGPLPRETRLPRRSGLRPRPARCLRNTTTGRASGREKVGRYV